jgi:ribosomal-protein-alanine N-acetyltransferase
MNTSKSIDPRDIFLKGEKVVLKVLTKEDATESNWYGWFNDEAICKTLQKHYFPNTREAQLAFYEKNINTNNKIQLGICKPESSNIIGIISLNNIDFINRKAEISAVIGESAGRNINLFIESCNLIINHAFSSLNLNRIYGGSISKELVTLMCRTLGCKEEGIGRSEIYKKGVYHDSYRYGILRDEFQFKSN